MSDKQIQKAGDGSQQMQAENVYITYGISEQRVREICSEVAAVAVSNHSTEAAETAIKRIDQFVDLLLPRIQRIEKDFNSFSDPSFQVLLRKAELTAACTERDCDYQMLSELLVHRIEKGEERKTKASISKAIEIVDQIDDDALCALTIIYVINNLVTTDGSIVQGLSEMNNLFSLLCYMPLPKGLEWAQHLDILNAVRVSTIVSFKKFREFYPQIFEGYTCVGIQKESDAYQNAMDVLRQANLPINLLVEHELNEGYVRLPVYNKNAIKDISIAITKHSSAIEFRKVTAPEIDAINAVWDLYSNDTDRKSAIENAFMEKWDTFSSLKAIRQWWEHLSYSITITPIGVVLAHANAQQRDKTIPDISAQAK